ncbi:MAG: hypothetical protein OHK0023_13880 [Anaerolineae bacterium]
MTISQLIQKQIPLGGKVVFILKTGQEVAGTLVEMSRDHVVVEQNDGATTILVDIIGSWKVTSADSPHQETSQLHSKSLSAIEGEETPSITGTTDNHNRELEQILDDPPIPALHQISAAAL